MYISEQLKEMIRTLVKQGYIRDAENPDYIADEVSFENNNIHLTFTDYSGSSHEYWEDKECTDEPFDDTDLRIKEAQEDHLFGSKQ